MVRTYFASQMAWNNQEMVVFSGLKYTFPCFRFTSSARVFVFPVPALNPAIGHRVGLGIDELVGNLPINIKMN